MIQETKEFYDEKEKEETELKEDIKMKLDKVEFLEKKVSAHDNEIEILKRRIRKLQDNLKKITAFS